MDGTPTARMAGTVVEALKLPTFDHGPASLLEVPRSHDLESPKPLEWALTPELSASIARAKEAAHTLVDSQTLSFLRTSYGKKAIKSMGYSPDSYAQMVIQLAYHRLINKDNRSGTKVGRIGGTYEAATTRKFQHGRTEAIRCVSEASEAWCAGMDAYSKKRVGAEEIAELFAKAVQTHGVDARAAGNGLGVDRHLFGMSSVWFPFQFLRATYLSPFSLSFLFGVQD